MFDDDDTEDFLDDDQQQQQAAGQQQQQQQQQPAIDPAQIAASVAAELQRNQPAAQPRQMTPEEQAAHFQIWDPDDDLVNGLTALADPDATPEQRKKILTTMRDGIMQQSFRAAQLLVEQQMEQIRTQFNPVLQASQEQRAKKALKEIVTKYPGLAGQDELIGMVTGQLAQAGFKPSSREEAIERVAQVAGGILKKVNPEFELKSNGGVNGKPSMATGMMGGQTGSVKQTQQTSGKRGQLASFFQS